MLFLYIERDAEMQASREYEIREVWEYVFSFGSAPLPKRRLFYVLQGFIAFLAGTYFYDILDVVHEDLAVTDVTGI